VQPSQLSVSLFYKKFNKVRTLKFKDKLQEHNLNIERDKVRILQVNIGKKCNQACHHCHVEAGPKRPENMTRETVDRLLELLEKAPDTEIVDITGGAPELNPNFRYFVTEIRKMGKDVIDRCNLTVLFEKGQEDTPEFLAEQGVEIVASLPCYSSDNVDAQRGRGVFGKSIRALNMLNDLGYGKNNKSLRLNLVYNPVGEHLPPDQNKLEAEYKIRLKEDLDIDFNNLYTITNMPIKRYLHMLERDGKLDAYMSLLIDNFNVSAAHNVMCTEIVSIGWDGQIYDCDFNQMLEIPIDWQERSIWDIDSLEDLRGGIAFGKHCYGCTAGAGSSCGGVTT